MKSFTVIALILGVVAFEMIAAAEKPETPENIAKTCETKTGATAAEIAALKKGDFSKPNEKIECYAKCILDHTEILEEGLVRENLLIQKLTAKYPKAEVEKVIKACKSTTGQDHCQVAYNLVKCYATNKIELI